MAETLSGEALRHFRHELRTPLNHIIGFAEIMIDDAGDIGRPEPIPVLQQIKSGGYALLESLQEAFPAEIPSMTGAEIEAAGATLRPLIAGLVLNCSMLEEMGVYETESEGLENLGTIRGALHGMSEILASCFGDSRVRRLT
jgi:signal transduction histidine kinase